MRNFPKYNKEKLTMSLLTLRSAMQQELMKIDYVTI